MIASALWVLGCTGASWISSHRKAIRPAFKRTFKSDARFPQNKKQAYKFDFWISTPQNAALLELDWIVDLPFRVVQRLLHSIVQIELEASWKSAERFELGWRHSCSPQEEPQSLMVRIDVFGLGEQGNKLLSRDSIDCFRKYARQRGNPLDILWPHHAVDKCSFQRGTTYGLARRIDNLHDAGVACVLAVQKYEYVLLCAEFIGRAAGSVLERLVYTDLAQSRSGLLWTLLVIYVDSAFWHEVVDIKSGGVRNIRTLVKRTGKREEGEVACYISALNPVFLRSDFDLLSEVVVQ
jgi:hypothetical protein